MLQPAIESRCTELVYPGCGIQDARSLKALRVHAGDEESGNRVAVPAPQRPTFNQRQRLPDLVWGRRYF